MRTSTFLAVLLVFLTVWMPVPGEGGTKWTQLPSMDPGNGYSFSSETQVPSQVADDFLCEDGSPVVGIRWWGSYWDMMYQGVNYYPYFNSDNWGDPVPTPPGTVAGFNINFYADVPAYQGVPPWSHPGAQMYAQFVPLDGIQVTETVYGVISRGAGTETVFQYDAVLPVPFDQEAGLIYWLSIQAVDSGGDPIQWGWHESVDHWNDNGVQKGFAWQGWWDKLPGEDMAFQLKAVPVPTSLLLLASGLLAGVGIRRKAHC